MFEHLKGSTPEIPKKSEPIPELPGFTIVLPKKQEENNQYISKNKKKNKRNKKKEKNEIRVCNDGKEVISDDDDENENEIGNSNGCVIDENELCNMSEEMQIELALKQSIARLHSNKENNNNNNSSNMEDEITSNNEKDDYSNIQNTLEFVDPPPKSKCEMKCMGLIHDLYINCVNCGFIMCKKDEKQKNCPSCGISMNREEILKKVYYLLILYFNISI